MTALSVRSVAARHCRAGITFRQEEGSLAQSIQAAYGLEPVPTDAQFATIVRAWPEGKKALLVSRPVLSNPSFPNYRFCAIGLRVPGFPRLEGVEAVFRAAVRAARQGAGAAEFREWLYSLEETKVRALATLNQLA